MKKIVSILSLVITLTGCEINGQHKTRDDIVSPTSPKEYKLVVNYIGNGVSNIPPSDTIVVISEHLDGPRFILSVDNGVSCLVDLNQKDFILHPTATYVRSFKLLK